MGGVPPAGGVPPSVGGALASGGDPLPLGFEPSAGGEPSGGDEPLDAVAPPLPPEESTTPVAALLLEHVEAPELVGVVDVGVVEVGVVEVGAVEVGVVDVGVVAVGAAEPHVPCASFVVSLFTTVRPAEAALVFGAGDALVDALARDFVATTCDLGSLWASTFFLATVRCWTRGVGVATTSGMPTPPDPAETTVPCTDDFLPDEPTSTAPAVTIAAAARPATAFVATAPIPAERAPAPDAATAEPAAAVPDPAAAPDPAAPAPDPAAPDPAE